MPFSRIAAAWISVFTVCRGLACAQQPAPSPTPRPIREEVIVTANRTETRLGDTPASVTTLGATQIASSAAPVMDDVLRQTVGFSIFRRSSSRNANPTTQGVSLRGLGASGASRSAILFDGVPLNDPFGGWVQWNRVAPVEVRTVEVLRGGASSLYGDAGLSGAVNVIPQASDKDRFLSADIFGGTQKTVSGSVFSGFSHKKWQTTVTGASFQTRGFIPVEGSARGPVDSFAGVRSGNISARISREFGQRASLFIRPSYFGEVRSNGTGLQTNRTHIRQLVLGGEFEKYLVLRWRIFGGTQIFDQMFSAVNAARTAENLTRLQRVPVQNIGFSADVSRVVRDHTLVAGVEVRNVRGSSDEIAYANGLPTSLIDGGGRQTIAGAFLQDLVRIGDRLVVSGSIRYDDWKNYDATSVTRPLTAATPAVTAFPDRDESAISPQASMLYHVSDEWSLYAAVSRGFRAPTLNELYRGFRVGNVITQANEDLRAEHANSFEAGVSFGNKHTFVRAAGFWTEVEDPIANVTLPSIPTLITRQRQNMGETRSRGIEIEGERRWRRFNLSGGYLIVDSVVTSFPANVMVEGRRVPQVPRHQFTVQSRYARNGWTLAMQGRAASHQFDDDLNLFRLEPFAQFDVFAGRELAEKIEVYAALENMFNSRYSVARTPLRSVSSPANFRVGMRIRL